MDPTYRYIGESKKNNKLLDDFMNNSTIDEVVLLSRYSYNKKEESLFSDEIYDFLLKKSSEEIQKRSYENDIYPEKVLNIIKKLYPQKEENNKRKLSEDKLKIFNKFSENKSMRYFSDVNDVLNNFKNTLEYKIPHEISFKHDGWNITAYYGKGKLKPVLAHTRGRDGAEVTDCTELLQFLLPELEVDCDTKVVGELVLIRSKFEELRERLPNKNWVNIRGSISSFVNGLVDKEFWDALEFKAFDIQSEDLSGLKKIDKISFLKSIGFSTPVHIFCNTKDEMVMGINKMIEFYVNQYSKVYECDGLVIGADSNIFAEDDLYSSDVIAYKGLQWGAEILKSKVIRFELSFNKKRYTPIAIVEPVKSRIGNLIRRVPLINIATVENSGIKIGSMIEIEYQSQQNVYFRSVVN